MEAKKIIFTLILSFVVLILDYYFYLAIRTLIRNYSSKYRHWFARLFWTLTLIFVALFWLNLFFGSFFMTRFYKTLLIRYLFIVYTSKLLIAGLLGLEDTCLVFKRIKKRFRASPTENNSSEKMTRSAFLAKSALIAGGIPFSMMGYGIISGAHDYQIRRVKLKLPNLPKPFHGLRIGQITDLHVGSFTNQTAVKGGIAMLLNEKTDMIFFTGDLVNYATQEVDAYFNIFQDIKAPLGVFSCLGNHDYGGYQGWPSEKARQDNLQAMYDAHHQLGWDLLRNENRFLTESGEKLAILGVENWGIKKRHPKLGDIEKAYQGTEEAPVKLLLSHDPSHWDIKVRPLCPDIDVMFAGHTHGMQFGIEMGNIKWSPVQYIYKQWAGLYQEGNQFLYVNRGFGYADIFPGRIGIAPEITIFELLAV